MDKKISQLGATTVPVDADLLAIVQSGITKKITYQNFKAAIISDADLDLNQVLTNGNTTSGKNIVLSGFDVLTGASTDFSLGFNNGSNFFVSYENGATSIYHSITASKNQLGWTDGVETTGIVLASGSSNFFHDTELYLNSPYITIGDNAGGMGAIRSHVPGESEIWFGVDGNQFLASTDGNILAESYIQLRPSSMGLGYGTDTSLSLDATDVYLGFASDHYLEITPTTSQLFWNSQGLAINTSAAEINHLTEINFNAPNTRFQQLTASTVPYLDASSNLVSSAITPTELGYISGATSSLQDQINALTVGLSWKTAVRGATTTTLPSYTVSGGNKILTATANGAFPTTDGVTFSVNGSILVKNETAGNAPNNGIYTVTQVGTAGTPWILTRRNDANTGPLLVSATVAISEGTTLQDTQYVCNTDSPISLGVTNITFVAVGGTTYVGTTNRITVTGNVIDISATFEALLGKVANPLSQFASTTSAQLAGVISDETGSGSLVFGTTPTFTTNITTPLIIGGTGVTDKITYKGTSGNGTSTAVGHSFVVGNNGATTALEILNNANVQFGAGYIGINTAAVTNQPITSSYSFNGQLISRFINSSGSAAAVSSIVTQNNAAQSQSSNKLGSAYTTVGLLTASLNWYYGNGGNTLYSNSAASTSHIWSIGGTATANEVMRLDSTTHTLADAINMAFGTTTGTKIGTATSQKLSLWNATPIVQPTTAIAASTFVANTSGTVNDTATFDGYTIGQVVKALRSIGILA
jgi:hypothetical protein